MRQADSGDMADLVTSLPEEAANQWWQLCVDREIHGSRAHQDRVIDLGSRVF